MGRFQKTWLLTKIEFEDFPIFYNHCKAHGHDFVECFVAHLHLRKKEVKQSQTTKNKYSNILLETKLLILMRLMEKIYFCIRAMLMGKI